MILEFFKTAANLKTIKRQGWVDRLSLENPESVADHTFSMAVIGMVLSDSKDYDTEKILKMILLHDLAESITGDFTPNQISKDEKIILENKTFQKIIINLPDNLQSQYQNIWNEYQKNSSKESKFVHQVDKLEMALQAKIYSKQPGLTRDVSSFYDSAEQELSDPNLLKLFKELADRLH